MNEPALKALLARHSLGGKHLVEPGPTAAELERMVQVALRAPDHDGLTPFRFAVVRGAARERLAQVFAQAARAAGKGDDDVALDAERARRAPVTVAVIARIDMGHPVVPAHEQWMAVGGALANLLNAAHLMGYAGKMLSGRKARDPHVIAAFCGPGETLVGWVSLGTAARAPSARERGGAEGVVADWPAD